MLGVIGIVVALVVLVALTFKGWHMGVVAIASSLIIILTSQMDIWTLSRKTLHQVLQVLQETGSWYSRWQLFLVKLWIWVERPCPLRDIQ